MQWSNGSGWQAWRERVLRRPAAQWPRALQCLACAGSVLLVGALAWLLVLQPQADRLQAAQEQQHTLQQQYRLALTQAAAVPALRAQWQQMQALQAAHPAMQPAAAAPERLLAQIQQAGNGLGVRLERLKPQTERRHEDDARRQKLAVKAVGDYAALVQFVAALPVLGQPLEPERWSLAPVRSVAGRQADQLQWQATLVAYRFALPGEGTGKQRGGAGKAAAAQGQATPIVKQEPEP